MAWPFKNKETEKEPSLEAEGRETEIGMEEEKRNMESSSSEPQTPTGGTESPFTNPVLSRYKTEQELAEAIALRDLTIDEQKAAVSAAGAASQAPVPEPEPEPPVEISSEDFFQNPGESTAKIVNEIVQKQLKEIIEPFRQDLARGQVRTAWDEAATHLPNLDLMRPLIEAGLQHRGITNPNLETIIAVHDLAVGQATRKGTPLPAMETSAGSTSDNKRTTVIPQHMPSTQPIAAAEPKVNIVPLSEHEARLARERKLTHEEYRALQEMDESDVLYVEEKA
jgi:hypothetical protein